jgi:hypothetical protein
MFSKASLKYLGGIRTPHEPSTDVEYLPNAYPTWGQTNDALGMGGAPFAIDYDRRELVLGTRYGRVARLQIVEPALHTNDDVNTFPVAPYATQTMVGISGTSKVVNPPVEDTSWFEIMASLQVEGSGQGGFLPVGDKILGAGTNYYDANADQIRSSFVANWPAENAESYDPARTPFVTMDIGDFPQGVVAGYFTPIPERWRELLKGDTLQGQAALPVITRGSAGPSASSFHVADLLMVGHRKHPLEGYPPDHWVSRYAKDLLAEIKKRPRLTEPPVPATMLVAYPGGHWMPGHPWDNPNADDVYSMASQITGMCIMGDTLVFAGSHGYGTPCYGNGTSDESLAGTVGPDGEPYCYDPAASAKANHAYPYRVQLWWYPLQDLADVAAGVKEPWSLVPEWCELEVPFVEPMHRVNGCAYDPSTKRFYLVAHSADGYGYEPGPVLYCWEFLGDDGEPPIPPEPPVITDCEKKLAACTLALAAEMQRHGVTKQQLADANARLAEIAVNATSISGHTGNITDEVAVITDLTNTILALATGA